MTKRNGIVAIVAIFVLLVGGWYFFANRGPSLPYTVIESGDRQHKEETDFYTIQVNYPNKTPLATRSGWRAAAQADKAIEDLLEAQIDAFKDTARENLTEEEKARLTQNLYKYSLNIGYKAYSSGEYVSYEFDIFADTGGAHPNNYYKTLVFDLSGNPQELGDLFVDGSNYLERVAEEARRQVTEQLTQRAGAEASSTLMAEGVTPVKENFENFVVDSDRIRIFIPPYQAAAYAAGSFEVQIPLADIRDILKPTVR